MEHPVDVVVVGAGLAGLATAFFLSNAGASVVVVEREAIGCGASGAAAGILSPFAEVQGPPPLDDLAREGLRLHRTMAPLLQAETGVDLRLAPLTLLIPAFDEAEVTALRVRADRARPGERLTWLDGGAARTLEPRLTPRVLGALCVADEARVDSYRLTLALARAAERHGAVIRYGRVVGLLERGDRVTGVRLARDRIPAGCVVLAAGPWVGLMSRWVPSPIPVTPLRGQLLHLRLPDPQLRCGVMYRGNYALSKDDGLTIVGTTEEAAGFRARGTRRGRQAILRAVLPLLPSLGDAALVAHTACLRPLCADGLPLLGPVPGRDGLYIAAGYGRRGVLLSLVTGQVMARMVLEGHADPAVTMFAPDRFLATASAAG